MVEFKRAANCVLVKISTSKSRWPQDQP